MDRKHIICCLAAAIIVSAAAYTASAENNDNTIEELTSINTVEEKQTMSYAEDTPQPNSEIKEAADTSNTDEGLVQDAEEVNGEPQAGLSEEAVENGDTQDTDSNDTEEAAAEGVSDDNQEETEDLQENTEAGGTADTDTDEPSAGGETGGDAGQNEGDTDNTYDISWYNEEAESFEIGSEKQMLGLMMLVNGTAAQYSEPVSFEGKQINMTGHIALESGEWTPIGQEEHPFDGVFNGNDFTVSRLVVKAEEQQYGGLFGYITGRIENLNIIRASVGGGKANGIAAGCAAEGSVIDKVVVSGEVDDGAVSGGIAGITYGTVKNSVNNANITASGYAGGITGVLSENGTITGCSGFKTTLVSDVNTIKSDGYAGGIAGKSLGTIEFCDNNSDIDSVLSCGGICAVAESGTITGSFSTGAVHSASQYAGGIVGDGGAVSISYCGNIKKPLCDDGAAGGIAGRLTGGVIIKSYALFELTDEDDNTEPVVHTGSDNTIDYCFFLEKSIPDKINDELPPADENGNENEPDASGETKEKDNTSGGSENIIPIPEKKDFASGRVSWLLNTLGGTVQSEKMWGTNGEYPVLADSKYKPVFRIVPVFNSEGGAVSVASEYCSEGVRVQIRLSSEFKYKLVDLWVRGEETKTETTIPERPYVFTMPREDVTVHAVFEPIKSGTDKNKDDNKESNTKYTVTFDANGGLFFEGKDNECEELERTVVSGRKVSAPAAPSREGYMFDGWFLDRSGSTEYDFDEAVEKNITLYAVYSEEREYTVTFDVNGGKSDAPKEQSVKAGSLIKDPGSVQWTDESKVFAGWSTSSGKSAKKWDFENDVMPRKELVLYAVWIDNDTDFSGTGTKSTPYIIKTDNDLELLAAKVKAGESFSGRYFRLDRDAVCTSPIGTAAHPFKGEFDGAGNTVTLDIEADTDYAGLFGYADKARIYDVNVKGSVSGRNYVGSVAGYAGDSEISGCSSSADVTASGSYAGGIAGWGSADDSEFSGTVSAVQYAGGIVGSAVKDMTGCVNTGSVYCRGGYTGGIAGDATAYNLRACENSGKIICEKGTGGDENAYTGGIAGILKSAADCRNTGDVSGAARTGGIAGRVTERCDECASDADVQGTVRVGGIAGSAASGAIISHCDVDTGSIEASKSYAGGICGDCEGKATVEFSHCLVDVEAGSQSAAGISARGGLIKYSFYYCEKNAGCPVALNADIYASYGLGTSSGDDGNFREPLKSANAFDEGMVSWLMNTDGGGEFSQNGNSMRWTTEDSIPVPAASGKGTIGVIGEISADGNEILINGKNMYFGNKGDTVEISYKVNAESDIDSIDIANYWDVGRIIKALEGSGGELTITTDYLAIGHFIKSEEKEKPSEEDKGKKDNKDDTSETENNGDEEPRKRSSKSRRSKNVSDGNSAFGSIDGNSGFNGTGDGTGGSGIGNSAGGGGQTGGGSGSERGSSSAKDGQRSDRNGSSGNKRATSKTTTEADNGNAAYETASSNIVSERGQGVSDTSVSFTREIISAENMADDISSENMAAKTEIQEYSGISEVAGRSKDVSSGSKKSIAKIKLDEYEPVQTGSGGRRIGSLALIALIAGFFSNNFLERLKRKGNNNSEGIF